MPETVHCRVKGCKKTFHVKDFADQMAQIRYHRKQVHLASFKKSVKKGVTTRKMGGK